MSKPTFNVGIIGCGSRGLNHIGFNIVDSREEHGLVVTAVANRSLPSTNYAAEALENRYREQGMDQPVKRCESFMEIIDDPEVDFIIITSHTDAHLEHTLPAIASGKKVYLEKPIAVNLEEGQAIVDAEKQHGNPIMMGFTRRYEDSWTTTKELLDSGIVGNLQMILLRSVIPYSRYLQGWWRKREWSGGPLNDKCSHHFDVLRWMGDGNFKSVSAFGGRSGVFKQDPDAPKRCCVCDRDCAYRVSDRVEESKETTGEKYMPSEENMDDRAIQDACVYSPDSDVEDFGSVNFQLDNGITGNLFFSIFGPLAPDGETLELVGDSGRLVLTRSSGEVVAISDHGKDSEVIFAGGPNFDKSHYGSDVNLIGKMRSYCDGVDPVCDASDGFASLQMVEASRASFDDGGQVQRL